MMKQTALTEQKPSGEERGFSTLHEALAALERQLNGKANMLERRRCSTNNYTHWKARGSQEALRQTAKHLRGMRREHRSSRALHTALSGYLHCLEKSCGDAREESIRPVSKRGMPVVQWKAEGEYLVLPSTCTALSQLLEDYTPEKKASAALISRSEVQGQGLSLVVETLPPDSILLGGTLNEILVEQKAR